MGGLSLWSAVSCCMTGRAVYESYVGPAILCGSEAWFLKESEMGILRRTVRSMCGVQL